MGKYMIGDWIAEDVSLDIDMVTLLSYLKYVSVISSHPSKADVCDIVRLTHLTRDRSEYHKSKIVSSNSYQIEYTYNRIDSLIIIDNVNNITTRDFHKGSIYQNGHTSLGMVYEMIHSLVLPAKRNNKLKQIGI